MKTMKRVKTVTARSSDFGKWYTDVCLKAELIAYSEAKGFIIYLPYGYALWENIQKHLNCTLQKTGHQNVYFPLVFPEKLFHKEKNHIQGFSPEAAMITTTGKKNLSEKLVIRPTSEILFSQFYSKTITSYRDLPKLYNQWCNVVRWEKTTKPFLRGKEFLWQEGHTVHATEQEAMQQTLSILDIYQKLGKNLLALPFVCGKKTETEKFAGALITYSIEALMHDGQALQAGTSHYLGTNFAKSFQIQFQDCDHQKKYVHQTSWGVSTRLIGVLIMVHSDDEGLVLPPYVSPMQIVIIPLQPQDDAVKQTSENLFSILQKNYRVHLDLQDKTAGWKFSQYELKGVPLRIEIGKRGLENDEVTIFQRYNFAKQNIKTKDLPSQIPQLFETIHNNMYQKALQHLEQNRKQATTYEEFKTYLKQGGYVAMSISGTDAELQIKQETGATARVILETNLITANCPVTNKKALQTVLFARAY
ncbi:proline--tRNA ligase 2 [Hydrangea phyllody phytoplasma]|uniref:Proline--tRNA ligase n=2 Tax=16SrI (Aster yellows group) TaxID=3042590 RepID=A0ABQ5PST1_9MOLU|nr:proline--tRNA ligase [Hydrangea phyllody phytoplasma]GFZ75393.1 proline--tRNA ligase 2 [Hydrangea phyllody phytoplasma]GLH61394.1 proline--tRNA ligase 2 [Rhus yellows phytoplasma]GLH61597.1 proline--tRNA ligase 2 [Hydrangea phyllody phytoplasma]